MSLVLNEEQRLLRDTARDFLAANAPVAALRKLRDERDPLGHLLGGAMGGDPSLQFQAVMEFEVNRGSDARHGHTIHGQIYNASHL